MPAPPRSSGARITMISRRDLPSRSDAITWSGDKSSSAILFLLSHAPYIVRYFHDQSQLGFFILDRQRISAYCAGEAALRRDSEIFEWHELRRLVDAPLHRVFGFQSRRLRADETQTHELLLWHQSQRRKVTGARRIVFEEEAVHLEVVEQTIGDCLVAACRHPSPAQIAAAEMHANRHAGRPLVENAVDGIDI